MPAAAPGPLEPSGKGGDYWLVALPFQRQIFAWLVVIALVPASIAIAMWVLSPQIAAPVGGAQAWERAADSWRDARAGLQLRNLPPELQQAVARHDSDLSTSVRRARQAQRLRTDLGAKLLAVALALAVLVGGGAIRLAGHLSRQLSRPIRELVVWTGHLGRGEPLPDAPPPKGAPEFATLRASFRTMADELARARAQEVEAARLRTFREMARQVAHELKNPLTPMRFALQRLHQYATPESRDLLGILDGESARLEQMARDFADMGRLPEGPSAPVDLGELLDTLAPTAPDGVAVRVERAPGAPMVPGHYEPLRRAFQNLFLNAVEAGAREIVMAVRGDQQPPGVTVTIRDDGPGMPADVAARIFEPYFTTRAQGTGLGLALVRQTLHDHGGAVTVQSAPGRGTTFTITLPAERT